MQVLGHSALHHNLISHCMLTDWSQNQNLKRREAAVRSVFIPPKHTCPPPIRTSLAYASHASCCAQSNVTFASNLCWALIHRLVRLYLANGLCMWILCGALCSGRPQALVCEVGPHPVFVLLLAPCTERYL